MDTALFTVSMILATFVPILAIRYLSPILQRVLRGLCDADGGSEFWVRCAYLMAVSGTLVLTLVFGSFDPGSSLVDTLRRTLAITLFSVFATVTIISFKVWSQVQQWLGEERRIAAAARPATLPPRATMQADAGGSRA